MSTLAFDPDHLETLRCRMEMAVAELRSIRCDDPLALDALHRVAVAAEELEEVWLPFVHRVRDSDALLQSDAICTALQLINFWQDPSVDIPRGRFYFTAAAKALHQVSDADLLALRDTPAITAMLKDCVSEARATMAQGAPLVHRVPGRAGWELRLVVQGGLRILDKIEALQFATVQQRPTLRAWDFAVMAWRALWM